MERMVLTFKAFAVRGLFMNHQAFEDAGFTFETSEPKKRNDARCHPR